MTYGETSHLCLFFIFFWNREIISKGWKESLESNTGILGRLTVWKQVYWQRTPLVFVLLQPSWSGVMHWGVRLEDWINREREGERGDKRSEEPSWRFTFSLSRLGVFSIHTQSVLLNQRSVSSSASHLHLWSGFTWFRCTGRCSHILKVTKQTAHLLPDCLNRY